MTTKPRWCATFDLNQYAASWMFLQFLINAEIGKPPDHQLVIEIKSGPFRILPNGLGRTEEDSSKILLNVMMPSLMLIGALPAVNGDIRMAGPSQYHGDAVAAAREGWAILI